MARRRSKALNQVRHARLRALQRYNVELMDSDIRTIVAMIQDGRARPIERQSRRLTMFCVRYRSVQMYPIFDRTRKTIVTFLTTQMVEDGRSDEDVE